MPPSAAKIGLAVQSGVSVICATCTRYWEGRDRGLPEPTCTAPAPCGSPLAGDDFHLYQGPITDFTRWCFVCGQTALHGVRARGRPRAIGVCTEHLRYFGVVKPVDHVVPDPEILSPTGVVKLEKPKKTLSQLMAETEAEWAQEG